MKLSCIVLIALPYLTAASDGGLDSGRNPAQHSRAKNDNTQLNNALFDAQVSGLTDGGTTTLTGDGQANTQIFAGTSTAPAVQAAAQPTTSKYDSGTASNVGGLLVNSNAASYESSSAQQATVSFISTSSGQPLLFDGSAQTLQSGSSSRISTKSLQSLTSNGSVDLLGTSSAAVVASSSGVATVSSHSSSEPNSAPSFTKNTSFKASMALLGLMGFVCIL